MGRPVVGRSGIWPNHYIIISIYVFLVKWAGKLVWGRVWPAGAESPGRRHREAENRGIYFKAGGFFIN